MKKYFKIMAIFTLVLLLTGCGKKSSITTDKFISIADDSKLETIDATYQFESTGFVKNATIAKSNNDWQIEFYELIDDAHAKGMLETNKATFETYKSNASVESSVSIKNYSTYELTTGDSYMYLCQVDNTLLFVHIDKEYKDVVKDLVKTLGY